MMYWSTTQIARLLIGEKRWPYITSSGIFLRKGISLRDGNLCKRRRQKANRVLVNGNISRRWPSSISLESKAQRIGPRLIGNRWGGFTKIVRPMKKRRYFMLCRYWLPSLLATLHYSPPKRRSAF